MNTLCIIQARLGSTRLPGKALMEIGGRPMLAHVVERAMKIRGVTDWIVAVPSMIDALQLAPAAKPLHVWHCDSIAEADVLKRYARLVDQYEPEIVVRITGDCPMLSPLVAEQVLSLYHSVKGCEYASNVTPGYIDGEDVEVVSREAIAWAHRSAREPYDREHVTSWIRRNVKTATLPPRDPRFGLKTSVDTLDDLERVRALLVAAVV